MNMEFVLGEQESLWIDNMDLNSSHRSASFENLEETQKIDQSLSLIEDYQYQNAQLQKWKQKRIEQEQNERKTRLFTFLYEFAAEKAPKVPPSFLINMPSQKLRFFHACFLNGKMYVIGDVISFTNPLPPHSTCYGLIRYLFSAPHPDFSNGRVVLTELTTPSDIRIQDCREDMLNVGAEICITLSQLGNVHFSNYESDDEWDTDKQA